MLEYDKIREARDMFIAEKKKLVNPKTGAHSDMNRLGLLLDVIVALNQFLATNDRRID